MAKLDQNRAHWQKEIDQFVCHSHIDTHFSSSICSAFEVDDLLMETLVLENSCTKHNRNFLVQNAAARLGTITN